jgi:hypothetical protein
LERELRYRRTARTKRRESLCEERGLLADLSQERPEIQQVQRDHDVWYQ